jgi:hypothetical protein
MATDIPPRLLADDILLGAPAISPFVFGSADTADVRRTYHLAARGRRPTFKRVALLAARKSMLLCIGTEGK